MIESKQTRVIVGSKLTDFSWQFIEERDKGEDTIKNNVVMWKCSSVGSVCLTHTKPWAWSLALRIHDMVTHPYNPSIWEEEAG